VVSDVLVDDEVPLVTSGISRSVGAKSFGGAHRGRVCVRVFIGVSVRACCERLRCIVSFSKKLHSSSYIIALDVYVGCLALFWTRETERESLGP
jgi:hypothetical protein